MSSEKRFELFRMFFSIVIALAVSFVLIFLVSDQPVEAIKLLVTGPVSKTRYVGNVIEKMVPLIFTGTGVCIMFSANQINLAGEGAFHLGGLLAACCALGLGLPAVIGPLFALIVAVIIGAIFCAIPAVLKIKTNSSVMVSSLMLNYIALYIGNYVLHYFIGDSKVGEASASYELPKASTLASIKILGVKFHIGLLVALAVAVLGYFFLYRSKVGYELRLVGENENFARNVGISIVKVILISQLVGGAIAGLGGGIELLSPLYARFTWTALLGYGWDAITITTLSKRNPIKTPIAALFLAYLRVGASIMARSTDVTLEIVEITEGIIILLVVAEQFLSGTKHKMIAREARKQLKEEEAA